jgi:glutamate N-acetyltransferase/amino-acid N-acetyltransferase
VTDLQTTVPAEGLPARLERFSTTSGVTVLRTPERWPEGFTSAAVTAGLKTSGAPDLMVLQNAGPSFAAAGVFTSNRFAAAPVLWSRQVLSDFQASLVVANSGGANACTGPEGFLDTHRTAEFAAQQTGVSAGDVVVASTGLIGEPLPMDRLLSGVEEAAANLRDASVEEAACAIMTTDSVPKRAEVTLSGGSRIVGIAKGAGMLAPQLATMLVFIATDAQVGQDALGKSLKEAAAVSFDHADADGCMSTNDTVVLLSSGAHSAEDSAEFTEALTALCQDLAYQLINDAEGASHTIAVTVEGAASLADAREVCRAISRSNLVKTAIFGADPNWGRILSSVGTTSAQFEPENVTVSMNEVVISRGGGLGEDRSLVDLTPREVSIVVDLGAGEASATILTSDLTHDYVHENSAYSS